MTARRLCRPLLVILAAALASPACYTLIKHPRVTTVDYEEVQDNRCMSCHSEEEIWGYHHSAAQRVYDPAYGEGWALYYSVPWWYESYWYYSPAVGGMPPLHRSDMRPDAEKGSAAGAMGGPLGRPPDVKSTGGSVRARDSDGGKADNKSENEKKEDRSVRPKTEKGKDDGGEKKEDGDDGKKAR